jgi:hypothetical protein
MTDIYRDPTDGATARRVDLLRRRRDELVTMPHAVRRVVVARGARLAASAAMALVGTLLVASAASPRISKLVGHLLPPDDPAVIATALLAAWLGGALVYAIARSMCEHRFAVAMTKCVLPGDDLHQDLERLAHETPDEDARRMAHAREVSSAAMPVLAAALVGPATLAYIGLAIRVHGWPANRVIEHAMQSHAGSLVFAGVLGVVAMAAVLFRRMRAPTMSVPMGVVAVTAIIIAALTKSDVATAMAAIAGVIAINTRTLRVERAWIETDDPAAGTELFALIKRRLADARRLLVAHYRAVALTIAVLALGFTGHVPTEVPLNREPPTLAAAFHRAIRPSVVVEPANQAVVPAPEPTPPHVRRLPYGVVEVEVTFSGSDATVPTGITIPPGWDSRIEAHVDYERSTAGEYDIDDFGHFSAAYPFQVITPTVCATEHAQPLTLAIRASSGTHHLVVVIRPSLTAAGC